LRSDVLLRAGRSVFCARRGGYVPFVRTVLCCLDDSDGARHAIPFARVLATRLGLELVLVHVVPPTPAPGVSAAPAGQERFVEGMHEAESLLARLVHEARLDAEVRTRVASGNAVARIVAICEEENVALVVVGSRGRGGIASALLGSVSSEVAAKAPCACVVVPPSAAGNLAFA
jgi:nucleotide-binding universal stress UspA family protein